MATSRRRPVSQVGPDRALTVTTFRIYHDQLIALKREALKRKEAGAGRMDASAVLREILDQAGIKGK
jgi:hypothetical protein